MSNAFLYSLITATKYYICLAWKQVNKAEELLGEGRKNLFEIFETKTHSGWFEITSTIILDLESYNAESNYYSLHCMTQDPITN